jgi:hypothetical protein
MAFLFVAAIIGPHARRWKYGYAVAIALNRARNCFSALAAFQGVR